MVPKGTVNDGAVWLKNRGEHILHFNLLGFTVNLTWSFVYKKLYNLHKEFHKMNFYCMEYLTALSTSYWHFLANKNICLRFFDSTYVLYND
jgi:hypothetical protein